MTWRCDEEWREAYIELSKDDYRNSTQWKRPLLGRATYWERPFMRFFGDAWISKIKACTTWAAWYPLMKEFEQSWHVMLNPESLCVSCDAPVEREKRPRDDNDPWTVAWCLEEHHRLETLGDNKVVISWMNGAWDVKGEEHTAPVCGVVLSTCAVVLGGGTFWPRTDEFDWCRHTVREHNKAADTHANWLMDKGDSGPGAKCEASDDHEKLQKTRHILLSFDGVRRGDWI